MNPKDMIVFALDVNSLDEGKALVDILIGKVGMFKIGLNLITAGFFIQLIEYIHARGGKIFLDGKFHDIKQTVKDASLNSSVLKVAMFNVHGTTTFESIVEAVQSRGDSLVLAVTLLTTVGRQECLDDYGREPIDQVLYVSRKSKRAGVQGLISSPADLVGLNECGEEFKKLLKVTPGIRPRWSEKNEQVRVTTPAQAVALGSHYQVIGRPIANYPVSEGGPAAGADRIAEEIGEAISKLPQSHQYL